MFLLSALGMVTLLTISCLAATPDEWRSRSIYQVMTDRFARTDLSTSTPCVTSDRLYCGGTWSGLISRLDYIQGMGFDAIWISPITAQIEGETAYGEAYHGYWQVSINKLNPHFGTPMDLMHLSEAVHARGMLLMVDVVVNHFAYAGNPESVDYTRLSPFSTADSFHTYCPIDYGKTSDMNQMEDCWMGDQLVSLPDLRTEAPDVAAIWQSWITWMVNVFRFDGLRLDSVMEVDRGFWTGFNTAAGVFTLGEVYQGDVEFVCKYQVDLPGVLNYPVYFPLIEAFRCSTCNMSNLVTIINSVKNTCHDTGLLGSFSENHDRPRVASLNGDLAIAQNILAFTVLADGLTIVYQGQEQHYNALGGSNDPYNREALWFSNYNTASPLYVLISRLNAIRKHAIAKDTGYLAYQNWPIWSDKHIIAMRKGDMVTVLTNAGSTGASFTLNLPSTYVGGTTVTELLTCTQLRVQDDGMLRIPMSAGQPKVFYPSADVGGLCKQHSKRRAGFRG